ncbi:uncharacterized protein CELE_C17C3.24 [Caenorhabditis elegans]|uniref:Uncharacterized protein n=1 Tax=Caenorhabditis elegans TaxID=6239 RepID=H2KYU1_CAEEL|nr:Uncharacterized protein CELE_C17C3.24 [Caenorhabditis elegans]CCE67229.1 Uncharacterized protein CELE_C17C3.24 [Caenorhabditis elegans]|eukprot:NP_001254100.1 Uncharacterized protein CELE_C17C3.24 [Caenorhabditis elegans]
METRLQEEIATNDLASSTISKSRHAIFASIIEELKSISSHFCIPALPI